MNLERIRQQLEPILNAEVRSRFMTLEDWNIAAADLLTGKLARSVVYGSEVLFFCEADEQGVYLAALHNEEITSSERKLVEWLLESIRNSERAKEAEPVEVPLSKGEQLHNWLLDHLDLGESKVNVPAELSELFGLKNRHIPFLLTGDYGDHNSEQAGELPGLLESFFETDVTVIPLHNKEWVILGPESLLEASGEEEKESLQGESLEDSLTSICYGMYEMLANEWIGECNLAVHYPIIPEEELLSTVIQLRETIELGRIYHLGDNIYFPWRMGLEKLLHEIPPDDMAAFVNQVFQTSESLDMDTLTALETFFSLDCNVSETAKRLYIHRNTLLYRLDKFKQETGLDVRTFQDAVLVKIALLLYKVTKRK